MCVCVCVCVRACEGPHNERFRRGEGPGLLASIRGGSTANHRPEACCRCRRRQVFFAPARGCVGRRRRQFLRPQPGWAVRQRFCALPRCSTHACAGCGAHGVPWRQGQPQTGCVGHSVILHPAVRRPYRTQPPKLREHGARQSCWQWHGSEWVGALAKRVGAGSTGDGDGGACVCVCVCGRCNCGWGTFTIFHPVCYVERVG